ncbi:MAG TPA: prenyltransferase/squalene oxidase repeat-containing protein [Planctomycetota bacterium]|nr:prenyltransferase/squalene oxidase repeat-containing protein [Planctomycetota bacterium]
MRFYALADARFLDAVGVPAGDDEPFVLRPQCPFQLAIGGDWLFLRFDDDGPTNEAWLASAALAPRPVWSKRLLREHTGADERPTDQLCALLPMPTGHAAVVCAHTDNRGSMLDYTVVGPRGSSFNSGTLLRTSGRRIDRVVCGGRSDHPDLALASRSFSGEFTYGHVLPFAVRPGGWPSPFALREPGARRRNSSRRPAEEGVAAALAWLAAHQDEDGKWDCDGFMKHDGAGEPCDGPGNAVHDVGVTGLALLCFLADGATLHAGPHRAVLDRGLRWLVDNQAENGLFGTASYEKSIYDHAIATIAVCEAQATSAAYWLRERAQRGIDYLEMHRNPYSVWRYKPRDNDNDTSVTAWCVQALWSARVAGLSVDESALKFAETFLDQVSTPAGDHGYTKVGAASDRKPGDHATRFPIEKGAPMTAAGLFCRFLLGEDPKEKTVMSGAANLILAKPPYWDPRAGSIDMYYWYYATYAMFQTGGRAWTEWQKKLDLAVVKTQRRDKAQPNAFGSWDPIGVWGDDGGRVYSTAMACLMLQAEHRLMRLR